MGFPRPEVARPNAMPNQAQENKHTGLKEATPAEEHA